MRPLKLGVIGKIPLPYDAEMVVRVLDIAGECIFQHVVEERDIRVANAGEGDDARLVVDVRMTDLKDVPKPA